MFEKIPGISCGAGLVRYLAHNPFSNEYDQQSKTDYPDKQQYRLPAGDP